MCTNIRSGVRALLHRLCASTSRVIVRPRDTVSVTAFVKYFGKKLIVCCGNELVMGPAISFPTSGERVDEKEELIFYFLCTVNWLASPTPVSEAIFVCVVNPQKQELGWRILWIMCGMPSRVVNALSLGIPWKHSRPCWMEFWITWSRRRCPCLWQRVVTRWS